MNNKDKELNDAIKICVWKYFKFNKGENVLKRNILNLIKEYVDYKVYDHYYPYAVHWLLESKCNLRCKHCLYRGYPQKYMSENDLSTSQALALIDDFFEMDILMIALTGGEIFLRKDIFEILTKIKTRNIALTLLTNATLITPEIIEKLKPIINVNTDRFQISLDGSTAQVHDKTRGKGAFKKTIDGIKCLIDAGFTTSLVCIPTNLNIDDLLNIYNLAQNMGVKYLTLGKFSAYSDDQKYLIPDKDILFKSVAKVISADNLKEKSMLGMTTFSFQDLINHSIASKFVEKYYEQNKTLKEPINRYMCHHNEKISIDKNGNVYPCNYAKEFEVGCIGNVKKHSLKEIWASRTDNILFQKRDADKIACKNCKHFQRYCFGGCPVDSYIKYGTINAPPENCHLGEFLMRENINA